MTLADKELVLAWRNSPAVAQYMYTDHAITAAEHDAWFRATLADPAKRYWVVEHQDAAVGLACLNPIDTANRRASWAFYIADPAQRGRGLGAMIEYAVLEHAFDTLGLHKLCCEVLATNRPALALHERFGFQREGLLREHIFKTGQFHDVVCLALTRPDWEARRAQLAEVLNRVSARGGGSKGNCDGSQ